MKMANTQVPRRRPRGRPRLSGTASEGAANPNQAIIRLQLDLPAKQALDKLCERRGMTQIAALSRTVRWLVTQDEILQAWVLNLMSEEHLGEMSQIMLNRTATAERK
jgi:hypothetical protein